MFQPGIGGKKKKKKATPNIEFVSPYPLEDCVWHLQNFPGVGEWFPIKLRVELSKTDEETWEFKVYKTYLNMDMLGPPKGSKWLGSKGPFFCYFRIQADGQLQHTDTNTTLVIGRTYVSPITIITNSILFTIVIAASILFVQNSVDDSRYILFLIILSGLSMVGLGLLSSRERYLRTLRSHLKRILGA